MKRFLRFLIQSIPALVLCSCSGYREEFRTWKEEVLLPDGRTIVVERSVSFVDATTWAGESPTREETAAELRFTESLSHLPSWNTPLRAILLYWDAVAGGWVLVATAGTCEIWRSRGQPPSFNWEFRLQGNDWREVPLSQSSLGLASNLQYEYPASPSTRILTLQSKQKAWSGINEDSRVKFIREKSSFRCQPISKPSKS